MIKHRLAKHSTPEPNSGCVLWCGATNRFNGGYGVLNVDGRTRYAHRLAWEEANGPIPEGMNICHKCDVRLCINPDHMFLGNQAENLADMVAKGRQSRGSQRPLAKLSESDVREIRASDGTLAEIAERFGINFRTVSKIRNGVSWKHVEAA